MIPYILRVGLFLSALFIFYHGLVRKETFYQLNRFILLGGIVVSFLLPLWKVPSQWSFASGAPPIVSWFANGYPDSPPAINPSSQTRSYVQPGDHFSAGSLLSWCSYLYWAGVLIFFVNFLIQLGYLAYLINSRPSIKDKIIRIVEMTGQKPPCSFGRWLFINPANFEWETYQQIIIHEKVHLRQLHSLDIAVAQFLLVFQWFNPFAWLYKKALENNLEFLADDEVLKIDAQHRETYQQNLVQVSAPYLALDATLSFNSSQLIQRIRMMNRKKSSLSTLWKYFFLLPFFTILVGGFNAARARGAAPERDQTNNHQHVVTTARPALAQKADPNHGSTFAATPVRHPTIAGSSATQKPPASPPVSAEFIRDFENAGYEHIALTQLQRLQVAGITADFAKSFWPVGYENIPIEELFQLKNMGVTPDYIRSFWSVDYTNTPMQELIMLKQHKITPDYIRSLEQRGYTKASIDSLLQTLLR
jgi:hypothetical protein